MEEAGQVTASAAEVYDAFFLPALFSAWPPRVVAAAGLAPGMRVIDVACGTGALTLAAAAAVAPDGSATGVDPNPGMLAVARRKAGEVDWREASAEALPFQDDVFDAVVSQFGLMFFRDRSAGIREMWRVLRPGGRFGVAVWSELGDAPGYLGVTRLLARLFGEEVADQLRAPYALGDPTGLESLLRSSGVASPRVSRLEGEARFPSIRAWMHTEVRGWTLSDAIDDDQFERLVREAERELGAFVGADGSVRFEHPALLATAVKP